MISTHAGNINHHVGDAADLIRSFSHPLQAEAEVYYSKFGAI
jgi:hypothetical protein